VPVYASCWIPPHSHQPPRIITRIERVICVRSLTIRSRRVFSASKACYSVEQIVAKLREAVRLQGQGLTIPQLCARLGDLRPDILPRWRLK